MNFMKIGAVKGILMSVHEIFPHIFCIFLLSWIKFGTGDVHYSLIESFMNTGIVKQYLFWVINEFVLSNSIV